jgi:uncharacterized protein YdcH (DUF465 family)
MLGEKHDLIHELPEYKDRIHALKLTNKYFANQFEKYHATDHEVLRVEEGIENTSDEYLQGLKKRRLALKDELFAMIKAES